MNKLIKKYLDIKTNEMIEASRLRTTVMFNSNLDIINNKDIFEEEEDIVIDGKKFSKSTIKEALKSYIN